MSSFPILLEVERRLPVRASRVLSVEAGLGRERKPLRAAVVRERSDTVLPEPKARNEVTRGL
jgi:hypothetical protein